MTVRLGRPERYRTGTLAPVTWTTLVPACPTGRRRIVRGMVGARVFVGVRTLTVRVAPVGLVFSATIPLILATTDNRLGMWDGGSLVLQPPQSLEVHASAGGTSAQSFYVDELAEVDERPRSGTELSFHLAGQPASTHSVVPVGFRRVYTFLHLYRWAAPAGTLATILTGPVGGPTRAAWASTIAIGGTSTTGCGLRINGVVVLTEGERLSHLGEGTNLFACWYDVRTNQEVF